VGNFCPPCPIRIWIYVTGTKTTYPLPSSILLERVAYAYKARSEPIQLDAYMPVKLLCTHDQGT
jgi:hypothetical protein